MLSENSGKEVSFSSLLLNYYFDDNFDNNGAKYKWV